MMNETPKCPNCGKALHLCVCDDEDINSWEEELDEEYLGDDIDAFGRNFSDADPGL